ncbi:hypothetical protein LSAT2_013725 [Lamellibrachia satsuma]|nr:hypothetical protein LSAT2_013725 [Lamellibrachia satsuma]
MAAQNMVDRGLPNLRRVIADQWEHDYHSHRRRLYVAPVPYANRVGYITGNIALGKQAGQSNNPSYDGSSVVDGNHGTCTYVTRSTEGLLWWAVDLAAIYNIEYVLITNGYHTSYLHDFNVAVTNERITDISPASEMDVCAMHDGTVGQRSTVKLFCVNGPTAGRVLGGDFSVESFEFEIDDGYHPRVIYMLKIVR